MHHISNKGNDVKSLAHLGFTPISVQYYRRVRGNTILEICIVHKFLISMQTIWSTALCVYGLGCVFMHTHKNFTVTIHTHIQRLYIVGCGFHAHIHTYTYLFIYLHNDITQRAVFHIVCILGKGLSTNTTNLHCTYIPLTVLYTHRSKSQVSL